MFPSVTLPEAQSECREQILGAEARSRVPDEFIPQLPEAANPPTLFLPLMALAQALHPDASIAEKALLANAPHIKRHQWVDFLQRAWPKLLAWYRWFDGSQAGPQAGSYRCAALPCHAY